MEVKNYFAFTKDSKPIPYCTAYLYYAGTNDLATGVKDKNGNPIDNPFTADANGLAQFTGPNGVYDLRFKSGVRDYRIRTSIVDTEALLEAAGQAVESAIDAGADAGRAELAADKSERNAEAAAASGEVYATTADALSNGVYSLDSLVIGSGGTDGTFALWFSGGAGSGAAGWFTVVGGAISAYEITARGRGYTSAPTVSFAASSGLTGASAAAVIAVNRDVGKRFIIPSASGEGFYDRYVVNAGPIAALEDTSPNATAYSNVHSVASIARDLAGVVWLDQSSLELTGATSSDWNYATYPHRVMVAKAVKAILIEGADIGETYQISQFNIDDPTDKDKILIADSAGTLFASTGSVELGILTDDITEVVMTGTGSRKVTMWIDYREITETGKLTSGTPSPLKIAEGAHQIIGRKVSEMYPLVSEHDSALSVRAQLGSPAWLDASAYSLVGSTAADWNYATYPHRMMVANAIKAILIEGADVGETYQISQFNIDDPSDKDKIIVADSAGTLFASTGSVELSILADDITVVVMTGTGSRKVTMWIDYREITETGKLTSGTPSPLKIAEGAHQILGRKISSLEAAVTDQNNELSTKVLSDRLVLDRELGSAGWLDPAMRARTGTTSADWNYASEPYRKMVARAIKAVFIDDPDPTKEYVISSFSVNHASNKDRIIIAYVSGGTYATTGVVDIVKKSGELTLVELGTARIWIDYTELVAAGLTATIVTGLDNPLRISLVNQSVLFDQRIKDIVAQAEPSDYGTIACFGDSITEFGDYPARIGDKLGADTISLGFGGCRMAVNDAAGSGVYKDWMSMYRLAKMINDDDFSDLLTAADDLYAFNGDDNRAQALLVSETDWSAVDVLTIFFGTNDWNGDIPIGLDTDVDAAGLTFKGAANYAIEQLLSAYPQLQVVLVSPMWRARRSSGDGLESDANPNTNGDYLIEFVDALIDVGNKYHIPVIDLYRASGINSLNSTVYFVDGLHPLDGVGYERIASKIAAGLKSVI